MLDLSLLLVAASASAVPIPDTRQVHHYVRTNSDGSEAEDIVVFARSPSEVNVMKAKSRCTNAAYVVGELDSASGQAQRLIGGRLQRDGTQAPFAWLDRDPSNGRLIARLGAPDAPPVFDVAVGTRWVLYDFDFADLIAAPPPAIKARQDFAFELPLLLTGEGQPTFQNLGRLDLQFGGEDRKGDAVTYKYRASGTALGGGKGKLWFDAQSGVLVEARLPLPNHSEYRDFRLRLRKSEQGELAWKERLAAHWRDCPPPKSAD